MKTPMGRHLRRDENMLYDFDFSREQQIFETISDKALQKSKMHGPSDMQWLNDAVGVLYEMNAPYAKEIKKEMSEAKKMYLAIK